MVKVKYEHELEARLQTAWAAWCKADKHYQASGRGYSEKAVLQAAKAEYHRIWKLLARIKKDSAKSS